MQQKSGWAPAHGVQILDAEQAEGRWIVLARHEASGGCPDCGKPSSSRHGWHERRLQDLPAQGAGVTVKLRMRRWRCRNKACQRRTFVEQFPEIAAPLARRTRRVTELVHLFGHGVGEPPLGDLKKPSEGKSNGKNGRPAIGYNSDPTASAEVDC